MDKISEMHKISVIIPIYNVDQYLSQCLESVINQTYKKLEIILVNDGSTDDSSVICDSFAAVDERFQVIHKTNEGSAAARNEGLQIATGDLIGFIDSDDVIALDFFEKLDKALQKNKADIAECGFIEFENQAPDIINSSLNMNQYVTYDAEAAVRAYLEERLSVVVWNKLYRKEVLKDILFPKGKYIDDIFWTYRVFGNSKKVVQIPNILYFYRQQEDSIMGKKYSLNRLDGLQGLEERIGYMKEKFPNLENLAIKIFCFGSMAHYQKIYENSEIDPQNVYRKKIVENVKNYNQISIIRKWDWKAVFWFQFFILAPNIFVKLRNLNETRVKMVQQKQL